ncbi:plasmid mobilization relaxosome protein MobC [Planktothrix sp. FACHB-1355]|uniref:Plasmid mobilization relaxosome protein MobC n=2 Tax=Cyanophyceae TaxID=3028117 RepID=A0A926VJU8_9CYAN|nr:plasmid mobilization relaxosome protein MobC [Aerosakkonema funiforme FACHB-1375]MBD3558862.1 plasmid mobilization relaxosome protein MobC [Planktothrix sp. FACHB-1355]
MAAKLNQKTKQRTIQFKLMLTSEEKEAWAAIASKAGLDISELVRRRMAGYRIRTVPEANWQCYWQLLKIGTNINQIAKAQNTALADGTIPPPIDRIPFEDLLRQIDRLRLHLILGADDEPSEDDLMEESDDWENW